MSNNTLKLYYFNTRGRAEIIRLILAAANRPYNDIRLEHSQWAEYKPNMLIGQMPILEFDDGTQLPQSLTIARYVARETGLAGENNLESAQIDAIVDTQRDLNEIFYVKIILEKDEVKKASELEKCINEDLVKHCENLAKLKNAYSKNENYFVGKKLSWADLFVYNSFDGLFQFLPHVKEKFYHQFKELFETIENHQNLKKYFDKRSQATH